MCTNTSVRTLLNEVEVVGLVCRHRARPRQRYLRKVGNIACIAADSLVRSCHAPCTAACCHNSSQSAGAERLVPQMCLLRNHYEAEGGQVWHLLQDSAPMNTEPLPDLASVRDCALVRMTGCVDA
jgi:hypothetical protein